ncbi:MAG TPA: N-acetylmuramic acid 6-phosphate etherase [Candidatus Tyrphobacter sp.]
MSEEVPQTEGVDERTAALDILAVPELVELLVEAQRGAVDAVLAQRDAIAGVIEEIARRLERGGRLHYVGAGTSGRVATLDAAEMPPTFGTDPGIVQAHIAGNASALVRAVEGAEDDAAAGDAVAKSFDCGDAVIGLSASGGAAYVVAAIAAARARGAFTAAIVNSDPSALGAVAERTIVLRTGPEALAGSTRLRAGTAQKIVLNTISTAVMIRLGKVYGNLMVDVVATNRKLRARALRLVQAIGGVDAERAAALLDSAQGNVKCAAVMARRGVDAARARALLEEHGGRLRGLL